MKLFDNGNYSMIYAELPQKNASGQWREGMISGDGENGFITSGAPYSDTFIFQNMWFNFPTSHPREIPEELSGQLEEARQAVFQRNDKWEIKQVHADGHITKRSRTFYYSFHPGMQLRLTIPKYGEEKNYIRWTNYETAEVGVKFSNAKGTWIRTSFTSRKDHVSITRIQRSSEDFPVSLTLSIDDILNMDQGAQKPYNGNCELTKMQYKKLVDLPRSYFAQIAHYPSYPGSELQFGGYATVTKIITSGGTIKQISLPDSEETMNVGNPNNPSIEIQDAKEICLITKSARSHDMGTLEDFAKTENYPLIEILLQDIQNVIDSYSKETYFSYEQAVKEHTALHKKEFSRVCLQIAEETEAANETLIQLQKKQQHSVLPAFLQRAYQQGRYAQICCSGTSAPRLCAMWTGEWNPGWRGIYTLDANVNIQVASMNTGHLTYAPLGYITFVLRNAPDWMWNAEMSYGVKKALQVSVNSDIDRGMHIEYDNDYPFEYWNAGASWCLLPIYEFWQCNGNQKIPLDPRMNLDHLTEVLDTFSYPMTQDRIEKIKKRGTLDLLNEILLPLLQKQANFWKGLCTPEYFTDADGNARYEKGKSSLRKGEAYLLIPGYSPENEPVGYHSTLTANVTMDIAAARDGLFMTISAEKAARQPGWKDRVKGLEQLLEQLPAYQTDESGALREWAMKEYTENNNHRHLSHMYVVWPGYELTKVPGIRKSVEKAMENRNRYNLDDNTSGFSWMHKALVEARLGRGENVLRSLLPMMCGSGYYTSFMTDHDTDRRMGCYCTDTLFGTVAVVHEMLVYSDHTHITLLPALDPSLTRGEVSGLLTRCGVEIRKLTWDFECGQVFATLKANRDCKVELLLASDKSHTDRSLELKAGQKLSLTYELSL